MYLQKSVDAHDVCDSESNQEGGAESIKIGEDTQVISYI
jgi:hypothetical protein